MLRKTEVCACGRLLHYNSHAVALAVLNLIEQYGEYITIVVGDTKYSVQRHYIALHGLKAADLPLLAEKGIVKRE